MVGGGDGGDRGKERMETGKGWGGGGVNHFVI